jgi:hypothetical protein
LCQQRFNFATRGGQESAFLNFGPLPKNGQLAHRFALTTSPIVHLHDLSTQTCAGFRAIEQRFETGRKIPAHLRDAFSANRGLIESMSGQS